MDVRVSRGDWIEEALNTLAEAGVDGVKVEPLARRLNVTKGGFYWHFKDRPDLLAAMLDTWKTGRIEALHRQVQAAGPLARDRIARLIRIYVSTVNPKGIAIELAIRDWARRDPAASAAAAEVDAERLSLTTRLYRELGLDDSTASAQAFLMYSFLFGQGLLVINATEEERAALVDRCIAILVPQG
ncbi:AcrR family transcriptional regulator [Azospirillum fermentarium]|uniref:TetR/AcrR family transcriptional regulator n=1 Tax=Azospirillum fermentarium TaxID=1233114 RepID=UPI0022268653|nr:TetR/AcrR family transcriptional regulator [Azospirillum fermentarium]MCW2248084.1 AcrR family transcriptional regulator [Azospirillum fermentarium]